MSAKCCASPVATADPVYRRVLWIALAINAAMFFVEVGAGAFADSTALLADAVDFFDDAANYGISLAVLALALDWLCSRNDAIGNIAVMFAALGVFGTGSAWPDLGVAAMLGLLALLSARSIISEALRELRDGHRIAAGDPLHHTGDRHG